MLQIRAVTLNAYLEVASFVGIDGLEQLTRAGIRRADLDEPERRLPADAALRLLEGSAAAARCQHFGILMAQCRSFASLGGVSLLFQHLATVGEVVNAFGKFRRSLNDVLVVKLDESDGLAMITFDLVPPFSKPQAIDLTVGLGLVALRGASGGRWAPEGVHLTHKRPDDIAPFEAYFRAPLEFDSAFNGFSCPSRVLDIALPLADSAMAENASRLLSSQPLPRLESSLADRVRRSIALLLPSGRAALVAVATNLGLNPRSLQRLLSCEGHTFAGLINEIRSERARYYLADSQMAISDIAAQLGYATPTSFARWFTCEFGMNPRSWRALQRVERTGPPPMWKV